jgi:hypothetical protein
MDMNNNILLNILGYPFWVYAKYQRLRLPLLFSFSVLNNRKVSGLDSQKKLIER